MITKKVSERTPKAMSVLKQKNKPTYRLESTFLFQMAIGPKLLLWRTKNSKIFLLTSLARQTTIIK